MGDSFSLTSAMLLYDAVTLRHLSSCGRLDICYEEGAGLPPLGWTEAVQKEISRADGLGVPECSPILTMFALHGSALLPNSSDLRAIYRLRVALSDGTRPPQGHGGEAESIYFARIYGGDVATDDNAAFDFAERQLGVGRVLDTVDILRTAVAAQYISAVDAAATVVTIRAAGRHLRRVHSPVLKPQDFE